MEKNVSCHVAIIQADPKENPLDKTHHFVSNLYLHLYYFLSIHHVILTVAVDVDVYVVFIGDDRDRDDNGGYQVYMFWITKFCIFFAILVVFSMTWGDLTVSSNTMQPWHFALLNEIMILVLQSLYILYYIKIKVLKDQSMRIHIYDAQLPHALCSFEKTLLVSISFLWTDTYSQRLNVTDRNNHCRCTRMRYQNGKSSVLIHLLIEF